MKLPAFAAFVLAAALTGPGASADGLSVTDAWSRSTPPGARVGAVYFTLRNDTKKSDRLLKLSTPVAEQAEVHRTEVLDGIARMREVAVLHVDAGQTIVLEPGGMHLMLVGLRQPLVAGTSYDLDLLFEVAGPRKISVEVRAP
ncbi:MAG: copper chaperone PCu(A)C [Gammaproteobacteria bacterium]|nr:copper chaperone PCu(A)C [Gammaproteobacteria bacterium]